MSAIICYINSSHDSDRVLNIGIESRQISPEWEVSLPVSGSASVVIWRD